MRKIKFRAWNKNSRQMIDLQKITPFATELKGLFIPENDELILMQYIGLKDKNGVEVYEGDVIQWTVSHKSDFSNEVTESHSLLEIRWGTSGWVLWSKLFKRFGQQNGDTCNEMHTAGYVRASTVIGDIYSNPDILEPKP